METFSSKGVEHVSDILSEKGIIPWEIFKNKYSLTDRDYFKWVQLTEAVPKELKDIIRSDSCEKDPSTILDCSNIVFINQKPVSAKTLTSKVIYAELFSRIYKKPTTQQNIERKLRSVASQTINWNMIYMLPRQTVTSTSIRMFLYHLLNNIWYFDKCLYKMKIVESPFCLQCKTVDETSFHFLVLVLSLCTSVRN